MHLTDPYPLDRLLPFTETDEEISLAAQGCLSSQQLASSGSRAYLPMTPQSYFYSSLKQADCLRFGTCRRMNNLSKAAQCQLWDALWTLNFDRFWKVNEGLLADDDTERSDKASFVQRAPIRCYIVASDPTMALSVKQWPVPFETSTVSTLAEQLSITDKYEAFLHGIKLDHSTPLKWLAVNCAYSDNFIHLVIHTL